MVADRDLDIREGHHGQRGPALKLRQAPGQALNFVESGATEEDPVFEEDVVHAAATADHLPGRHRTVDAPAQKTHHLTRGPNGQPPYPALAPQVHAGRVFQNFDPEIELELFHTHAEQAVWQVLEQVCAQFGPQLVAAQRIGLVRSLGRDPEDHRPVARPGLAKHVEGAGFQKVQVLVTDSGQTEALNAGDQAQSPAHPIAVLGIIRHPHAPPGLGDLGCPTRLELAAHVLHQRAFKKMAVGAFQSNLRVADHPHAFVSHRFLRKNVSVRAIA